MTPMSAERGVVLAWDVESWLYAAKDDQNLAPYHIFVVMRAFMLHLDSIAHTLGTVVARVAAMVISDRDQEGSRFSRYQRLELRKMIEDFGFDCAVPAFAPNAADVIIAQKCREVLASGNVIACVLATGDGKMPFRPLAIDALRQKKLVHWTAYRTLPESVMHIAEYFGGRESFSCSVVSTDDVIKRIGEITSQSLLPKPSWEREQSRSSGGLTVPLGSLAPEWFLLHGRSVEASIEESFQLFLRDHRDSRISERHCKIITAAIGAAVQLSSALKSEERVGLYHDIESAIRSNLRKAGMLDVRDEELQSLLRAILRMDLFMPKIAYSPYRWSRLAQWFEEISIMPTPVSLPPKT